MPNSIYAMLACFVLAAGVCSGAALNAKDFGATGLGKKDDSGAIGKALDACASKGGGIVKLPAGKYRLDKPITVPEGVMLSGEWEAPHHAQLTKGTVILAYAGKGKENDPPLVSLSPSSGVKGMTFFYPEQRIPGTQPYPWTIQGSGMHGSVIDVTLVNAYKAIDFGTNANELHYIRNVFGCPLKIGVFVDRCTDIGRIENVHFNPHYWGRAEAEGVPQWGDLIAYIWNNCTAFEFGRSDWEYVLDTFSFGCKVGMRFFASPHGACNGNFLGNGVDWAQTAILVEQTQEPGLLFTNGEFVGGTGAETAIEVTASHRGVVQFSNCAFWGPTKRVARIDGDGMVSFNQCNFVNWAEGVYAIEAAGGDVSIQACRFSHGANHVSLGPDVKTAVISGNTMSAAVAIDNRSKGDVQITGNVSRAKKD
ncbi:MAG TPA: glycosyl hydrolase family 28-related protein [Armatimonadota bacterium]|nr:glycosyl hydrolase family 28-related protein [Armatimonadota bacterium]